MIGSTLHIEEKTSQFFIEMGKISHDLLNHGIQSGGKIVAKIAARKLKENVPSMWSKTRPTTIGKKQITFGTAKERFGDRIKKDGSQDSPNNLAAMIKYYLNEDHNLVVIMGRHPRFIPIKFVNGERRGRQGTPIGGTARGGEDNERDIINIFQKLNDGGTKTLSTGQSWLLSRAVVYGKNKKGEITTTRPFLKTINGKLTPMIKTVTYRRTLFAEKAFFASRSLAVAEAKKIYDAYFEKVMKKIGAA